MSTARMLRRWRKHERFMVRCERNGATASLRGGFGPAHEDLMGRLVDRGKLRDGGDWWK
jgi:hypothetical protein